MGHFAVGATAATILLVAAGRIDTWEAGWLVIVSGLWAVLPDVGYVLPSLGPMDTSPLANLCWMHYTLDTHAVTDSTVSSAVAVLGLGIAVTLALTRAE